MSIQALPNENLLGVLKHFKNDPRTLGRCSLVCRGWHALANVRELMFIPQPVVLKRSVNFIPIDPEAKVISSDSVVTVTTDNQCACKVESISIPTRESLLKRKFLKNFSILEKVALVGQRFLVILTARKMFIRNLDEKGKKISTKQFKQGGSKVVNSSPSLQGLAVTSNSEENITVFRNSKTIEIKKPANSIVEQLYVTDNFAISLVQKLKKNTKDTIIHKIFAYPLDEQHKKQKILLSIENGTSGYSVASDNNWVVVHQNQSLILTSLADKKEQHSISFSGQLVDYVLKNHLLVAVLDIQGQKTLVTWNANKGNELSRISLEKSYKQMDIWQNIAIVIQENSLFIYRIDPNCQMLNNITISDLPKTNDHSSRTRENKLPQTTEEELRSIQILNASKLHIKTSHGLYVCDWRHLW